MLDLHRFMVAVSRIEVNYDGFSGTAPDALVWDQGGIVKDSCSFLSSVLFFLVLPIS